MTKGNAAPGGDPMGGAAGGKHNNSNSNITRHREKSNANERHRIAADVIAGLKFRHQVGRLHRLGPRPMAELLAELGAERGIQTIIDRKLERYIELTPEQLKATGGDHFPPTPIHQARP